MAGRATARGEPGRNASLRRNLVGPVEIDVADGDAVDGILGTHFQFHFAGHAAGADSGIDAAALSAFDGAGEHHASVLRLEFDVQVAVSLYVDAGLVESAVVAAAVAIAAAAAAAAAEVKVSVVVPASAVAPAVVPAALVATVVAAVVPAASPIVAAAVVVATVVVATASGVESAAAAAAPEDVKSVAFAATFAVFDANDSASAVVGPADQILSAAAVDSFEAEIVGTDRHFLIALETTERGGCAVQGTNGGVATGYFHFGDAVDFDFDGAFAVSAASADFSGTTVGDALGPGARQSQSQEEKIEFCHGDRSGGGVTRDYTRSCGWRLRGRQAIQIRQI